MPDSAADPLARSLLLRDIRRRLREEGLHDKAGISAMREKGYGDFFELDIVGDDVSQSVINACEYVRVHKPRFQQFVEDNLPRLDPEQRATHDAILKAKGGIHYITGRAGCGKSTTADVAAASFRVDELIVLF
eukprot:gene4630-2795_t